MGLGNKKFRVEAIKVNENEKKIRLNNDLSLKLDKVFKKHPLKDNIIYFISPTYIKNSEILKKVEFSSVSTANNRPQIRYNSNKIVKEKNLFRFIDSGSIILTENKQSIIRQLENDCMSKIGYNHIYYTKGDYNED